VSREAEFDGLDDVATHIVGVEDGELVSTCRLLFEDGVCRLGRMAVARERRRGGAGRRLIDAAVAVAQGRGAAEIVLHAQRQAELFYAAAGFTPEGGTFDEEGIPHVLMRRALGPSAGGPALAGEAGAGA
jgi:predicted GNAT family N-acyltransferase